MIRIRLINEGRVVKQITSRLHEGVVLEQIKKYKDPYDTVQIVEGELSEGAKDMLHHVAKKIVPAALAAGMAMSGASNAQAQGGANPHYPGLNHSVGQQLSDIFSPNYKELRRQREHQRSTERQVWDAEQNEIRKQRVNAARAAASGGQQHVIYDQSRLSQDGKSYIIYGIDNKVRRIPVAGTEYMAGDSQRLPHYITSGGNVLYVRHPHAVTESVEEGYTVTRGIDRERYQERPGLEGPFSTRSGKVVYYDPKEGKYYDPETDFYIGHEDYAKMDEGTDPNTQSHADAFKSETDTMKPGTTKYVGRKGGKEVTAKKDEQGNVKFYHRDGIKGPLKRVVEGVADSLPLNDALKVLRQYGAENLKTTTNELHFYKNGKAFSVPLTFNDDSTRSVPLSSLNSATRGLKGQGVAESDPNATVGTIPSTGTSGSTGRTQFAPTGKTTNAKFNKNGQIELDTEQEDDGSVNLDADAVKQLQQAGVQIKEGEDSPVAAAIARRIMTQRLDLLQQYGPVLVTQAIDEVADFVGDVEEIGSSDVSGWVKHVEQMLRDNPPAAFGEASDTLEGILSKYSADYAKFKAGGDIDENQDFFDALYAYYSESGEMPYGVQKARDGDPYEWITQRLDHESGVSPVIEADGDEASADQNIIMQIRKASDYEKPTKIELADGTESVIAPNIARQLLDKFDKMKPESKELLQNTLNTEEGFKEIIAYFGGGVREQAAARVGNIMQAAMAEAGYGRYDRRDAYQRDYDSSVAGMGKRQSYAYQMDGGANDEGWDKPEQERSYYKKSPAPAKKGYYFYNVPADQTAKAEELGLFKTKSGKWYSPFENTRANMFFGAGRYWEPK